MKILSLFDGISCAKVALENSKHIVERYYASEIDKYAIQISEKNFKDVIHIGDVKMVAHKDAPIHYKLNDIDLLIGGSPCQDLSISKKNRKGLDGERSGLFWEYVRILKEVKPKYFILENVASMSKESKRIITETLGVEPIMINASLVSAQNRKRFFWTNIPNITLPEDRKIYLKDILETGIKGEFEFNACSFRGRNIVDGKRKDMLGAKTEQRLEIGGDKANTITSVYKDSMVRIGKIGNGGQGERIYSVQGKSVALSALGGGRGAKTGLYETENEIIRKLTPIECERLQGLSDNYTAGVSNSQRYKMLGNAFNTEVIGHILTFIPR